MYRSDILACIPSFQTAVDDDRGEPLLRSAAQTLGGVAERGHVVSERSDDPRERRAQHRGIVDQ